MWNASEANYTATNRLFSDGDYEVVRRALGALPASQQEAVHLRFWEGLSISEIAWTSNKPWASVFEELGASLTRLADLCLGDGAFSRNSSNRT